MNKNVNREMVTLARETRGMTQSQLAKAIGATQGKVSKYESGMLAVSLSDLHKISRALDYPEEFFYQEDPIKPVGSSCLYHRKRQTMPVMELRKIQARVVVAHLHMRRLLRGAEIEADNKFHCMDVDDYEGPEEIARLLRKSWGIPAGPIPSMADAIESAGGVVFYWPFGTRKLDAISQWVQELPPLIFANTEAPADRVRYSLAHELGHLIMHRSPTPDQEREADRFAAEFLMPAKDIKPHLQPLSIAKAAALKPHWKVSIAAIIKRAFDIGVIKESYYRKLYTQLSKLGYRMSEPSPLNPEQPTMLADIIDLFVRDHKYTVAELSKMVHLHEGEFRETYLPQQGISLKIALR